MCEKQVVEDKNTLNVINIVAIMTKKFLRKLIKRKLPKYGLRFRFFVAAVTKIKPCEHSR